MLQFHAADGGNATRCRCEEAGSDLCVMCSCWESMLDWQNRVWYYAMRAMIKSQVIESNEPF